MTVIDDRSEAALTLYSSWPGVLITPSSRMPLKDMPARFMVKISLSASRPVDLPKKGLVDHTPVRGRVVYLRNRAIADEFILAVGTTEHGTRYA